MVFHVEPVAHLQAVTIDRQRFAGQGVDNHQRVELLGEVAGAIVVAAVGGEHRQAVGVVPGTHQVVTGGFTGAVGAVGLVGVRFRERGLVLRQAAVDLVGIDVQEAEGGFVGCGQAAPVSPHGF